MLDRLKGSFAHAPRTLGLVWRSSPRGTIALGAITIVAAMLPVASAYVGKAILEAALAHDRDLAVRYVLVELGLVALQGLAQRLLNLLNRQIGARLGIDVNVLILEKAQALSLAHFEDSEFYDQLTRARREASSRPLSVVTGIFELVQNALTLAGYIALLVRFSGLAVVGLVVASIPAAVSEIRFSNAAFRLRNWKSPETRRLNYLEHVLANDGHAKEVKLFGLGPLLLGRYKKLAESLYDEDRKLAVRRTVWGYSLSLLAKAAFYGCYVVMGIAAAAGELSPGDLVLYVVAFRQGQQAFQAILSGVGGMYEDNLYMSNLFSFFAIDSVVARAASPEGTKNGVSAGDVEIAFEDVGFRYPGKKDWALRHVDLTVKRGESLALVGHNGAGKTTLVKLLGRLYEPTEGRVLIGGKDVRDWDPDDLRRRIGVIFQDFARYQLTLRENVGLGSVPHMEDDGRIRQAADRGGAKDFIARFTAGLDTQLGRWFKEGVELSGGQWQKIALSRAFMREEAEILVLDEPTAALDAESEHAVFQRFRELSAGRTTVVISHRFPTVRMADRIVVLDGGGIVEEGTHAELVAVGGRYARMFALQAEGYT